MTATLQATSLIRFSGMNIDVFIQTSLKYDPIDAINDQPVVA